MKLQRSFVRIFTLVFSFTFVFIPYAFGENPLDNWHWRNPMPQGDILWGVTCGLNNASQTYCVAVGGLGNGVILSKQPAKSRKEERGIE